MPACGSLVATMLQISQTENPMCSATIDQIRLRRAMNLPLEFQNVSFSGFQSELQVRSLELISRSLYFERRVSRHGCAFAGHGTAFCERLSRGHSQLGQMICFD